jgi:hypothetical protein
MNNSSFINIYFLYFRLSYEDFLGGYYICAYDLSTSMDTGEAFTVPSVKVGKRLYL